MGVNAATGHGQSRPNLGSRGHQHEIYYMDWQCFDYKIMERGLHEYTEKLEELSTCSQL